MRLWLNHFAKALRVRLESAAAQTSKKCCDWWVTVLVWWTAKNTREYVYEICWVRLPSLPKFNYLVASRLPSYTSQCPHADRAWKVLSLGGNWVLDGGHCCRQMQVIWELKMVSGDVRSTGVFGFAPPKVVYLADVFEAMTLSESKKFYAYLVSFSFLHLRPLQ